MRAIAIAIAFVSTLSLLGCSSGSSSGAADGKGNSSAAPGAGGKGAGRVIQLPKFGLKGTAAGETEEPMVGSGDPIMISGATFTLNVSEAKATDPKTIKDAEEAAKSFNPKNSKTETLPDGWVLTYQNTGSMGENYMVTVRREIGGKGYLCETMQSTPDQQKASVAFCKSLSK